MKNWVVMFMAIIPIYQEISFDKWRWRDNKDDKPVSTYIRITLFVVLGLVTGFILDGPYLLVAFLAGLFFFASHWLFFDPCLNISRKPRLPMFQRKEGEMWHGKPYIMEYTAKIWTFYVTWLLLFHWEFVLGKYETQGTWWQLFSQFITF